MTNKITKVVFLLIALVLSFLVFQRVTWINAGGPLVIVILFLSFLSVALMAAKIRQFARLNLNIESFLKSIFEQLERQRIKEALDLCDRTDHPIPRILKAGIMKYDRPKDEIKEAMEDSFLFEIPILEDKLPALSALIQIVPLIGFLGSFIGFINIFGVIHAKKLAAAPVVLLDFSPGIWQALICPTAGFFVVIPALFVFNYLTNRVKVFINEAEKASTELLTFLIERRTAS